MAGLGISGLSIVWRKLDQSAGRADSRVADDLIRSAALPLSGFATGISIMPATVHFLGDAEPLAGSPPLNDLH